MKVQYTVRIEADLLDRAKNAADKEMRSLNNFIERAISIYLDLLLESSLVQKTYADWIRKDADRNQEER